MTQALVDIFGADQRIVSDSITGKLVGHTTYAESYLCYLQVVGEREERRGVATPNLPVWNLIYTRGWGWWTTTKGITPVWRLGEKRESTASVLFGLALGRTITTIDWDLFYYPEEQILTIATGGQHRSLAHMLWGISPPDCLEVDVFHTTNRADPALNQALLLFESTLPMGINPRGMNNDDFTRAKELYLSTPAADRSLIAKFLSSHQETWMPPDVPWGSQLMRECMSAFTQHRKLLERFRKSNAPTQRRLGADLPFYEWLLNHPNMD